MLRYQEGFEPASFPAMIQIANHSVTQHSGITRIVIMSAPNIFFVRISLSLSLSLSLSGKKIRTIRFARKLLFLRQLVSWCFKPSQPQSIISGMKEIFIKRYMVETTNKAEVRPEEQSEKPESCRENLLNEIQYQYV